MTAERTTGKRWTPTVKPAGSRPADARQADGR
jgi:hypothetical protein